MVKDLWNYAAILACAAVLGYVIDATAWVMLAVAIGIIIWQLHCVNLIQQWLDNSSDTHLPEMDGLFYLLHKKLTKRNQQYSKRKKQLTAYLAQFRKAVSALPDAIVLIDANGKIEWANSHSAALLGIRWPEDASVRFKDLMRHPEMETLVSKPLKSDQVAEINSLAINDQTINIKSVPYSETTRMIIARDVSQLIKVNQLHTDFVANVSHELKTPLTVLKGYVEILQTAKDLPEKFIKPLEQMNLQSVRMQFIVSDLLYLAKLEDKGNIKPHQKVQVALLINTIIEAVQPLLDDKKHSITVEVDADAHVMGAETELHSAFSNLITNAIKYTQAEGKISVLWKQTSDGPVLTVKDNGFGIPSHHLSRLTQRFYRVDTDRSREGGGTGLGLAIVKHVLHRHNAELDIQSTEGTGSTFSCQFPPQTGKA